MERVFTLGDRVKLHPATDLWARGARYGAVVAYTPGTPTRRARVRVKLDRWPRPVTLAAEDVAPLAPARTPADYARVRALHAVAVRALHGVAAGAGPATPAAARRASLAAWGALESEAKRLRLGSAEALLRLDGLSAVAAA